MVKLIYIRADSIDDAAEEVIRFLKGKSSEDVIYFYGHSYGLGTSAILKAVVKRLKESLESSGGAASRMASDWDRIIHVDCSLWKSKRVLQKVIAEELKLPKQVMAIFDQQDEEDDYEGVEQSSRGVIPRIRGDILNALHNKKFLVVFHNGSGSYIDLWECGVPVIGSVGGRVLWTSFGRFRIRGEDIQMLAGLSDVALLFVSSKLGVLEQVMYAEAKDVAEYTGLPKSILSPIVVLECLLYRTQIGDDYSIDWGTDASNYWVCDGIIGDANNGCGGAWEIANALQMNMNLALPERFMEGIRRRGWGHKWMHSDRWISTNVHKEAEAIQVPPQATSYFCLGAGSSGDKNATLSLDVGMFEHSDRRGLHVLHLSQCTFSFSSPPFLSCSNLRFLLLDHCKDKDAIDCCGGDKHQDNSIRNNRACFLKLWVLDLRHTDWYLLLSEEMMDEMDELRELNVEGVTGWTISHLRHRSGAKKQDRMHRLRVTAAPENTGASSNIDQVSPVAVFPDLSCWTNLKTVILNGCDGLEELGSNVLPPSLESFSFASNVTAKLKSISFRRCFKLKDLLLEGLFGSLLELDMSGTAVKTLNLSALQAPSLRRLFLLGCRNLCAILWSRGGVIQLGQGGVIQLEVLRIDTTAITLAREDNDTKEHSHGKSVGSLSPTMLDGDRALGENDSYISLRDSRLFRSVRQAIFVEYLNIEIFSSNITASAGDQSISHKTNSNGGSSQQQAQAPNIYLDDIVAIINDNPPQTVGDISAKCLWPCPPLPTRGDRPYCYIIIHDEKQTKVPQDITSTEQETSAIILPDFVPDRALTLHVHDSLAINCIPGGSSRYVDWNNLRWCRVERCPNIEGTVFIPLSEEYMEGNFLRLETFWASQLLKARYIWDWGKSGYLPGSSSFVNLKFLHLDCCPNLVHVLPLYTSNTKACRRLETLEIVCCGNLREVFPSDSETRQFDNLKRVHLYELPKLEKICGHRMSAPNLETVKIRGCWRLRRLPAVRSRGSGAPPPKVDCEKEFWDGLEWDKDLVNHDPSLYEPIHSKHKKKTLLRNSVLR